MDDNKQNVKNEGILIKRHLAKTITWRIVGTIDTMIIGWFVTGNPLIGLSIGGVEVITKMLLYYAHERAWLRVGNNVKVYRYRHLIKTVSWRTIGTIDTILITWIIAGDLNIGIQVGGIEVVTKMILYYIHERIWHNSIFGVEK